MPAHQLSNTAVEDFELGEVKFEDTNVAGIGSDEDKAMRKRAAMSEPAWEGCGRAPGIEIWRVEQFRLVPWPLEEHGNFYEGDTYVVLHTAKGESPDTLSRDVYFWLGLKSTADEQGTAAYKAVELDDLFDGACVQHREVQMYESRDFKALFKRISYLKGGVASGFRHVGEDGAYAPRLLIAKRVKGVVHIVQVPTLLASLNEGDAFSLDAGAKIYTWFGKESSPFEKQAANAYAKNLESGRSGKAKVVGEVDDVFWSILGGQGGIKAASEATKLPEPMPLGEGILMRLSDASGELHCDEVARGELSRRMLKSDSVYLCDVGQSLLLWVGKRASDRERRAAMSSATRYLRLSSRPLTTPVCMLGEGQTMRAPFSKVFAN